MPQSTLDERVDLNSWCAFPEENGPGQFRFKGGENDVRAVGFKITGRKQRVTMSLPLNGRSEVYVLAISNCWEKPGTDMKLEGTVAVKNPHGYLPATEYPRRVFYAVMAIVYIAATSAWAFVCLPRWQSLLTIQKGILAVGIAGALENIFFFVMYEIWNLSGDQYQIFCLLAMYCSSWKLMEAFSVLLVVPIAECLPSVHTDDASPQFWLQALLSLYMVAEFNAGAVQGYRLSHSLQIDYILLNVAPAVLLSLGLYAWANRSLLATVATLKEPAPTHAEAFFRSHVLVIISMVGACFAVGAEVLDPTTSEAATWSTHWLCAGGVRQILFLVLFASAMAIWFPRHELTGYEYEQPGNEEAGQMIGIMEEVEALPDEEGEAAHE